MSSARFISTPNGFYRKNESFKDLVIQRMARDIEVNLKTSAGMPVSATKAMGNKRGGGGNMKAQTRHFQTPSGGYRVEIDVAYAAYQERGMRKSGSHVVRNYSTPGTSKGFFKRAIQAVRRNRQSYIMEARRAAGL